MAIEEIKKRDYICVFKIELDKLTLLFIKMSIYQALSF